VGLDLSAGVANSLGLESSLDKAFSAVHFDLANETHQPNLRKSRPASHWHFHIGGQQQAMR
jgi:hypothetical protein